MMDAAHTAFFLPTPVLFDGDDVGEMGMGEALGTMGAEI